MKILAIDTSSKFLSLAVAEDKQILAASNTIANKILSSMIIEEIEKVIKQAGLEYAEVEGIAVGLGPGSFTSLRVGLATVKGLAFTGEKKVVGSGSLDTVARSVQEDGLIAVMNDARRGLIYGALYERRGDEINQIGGYHLTDVDSFVALITSETIFIGDAVEMYQDKLSPAKKMITEEKLIYPKAEHLIPQALERFQSGKDDESEKLAPLYLYKEDCQVTKK